MVDDSLINALGFLVAAAGFGFGVFQYRVGRLEARRQFAARAIEAYLGNPDVRAAMQMLDWRAREMLLPPGRTVAEGAQKFTVAHTDLDEALVLPHENGGRFTPLQVLLRDTFDRFINELEHLANQEQAKAFRIDDVAPYLAYLAELVFGTRFQLPAKTQAVLQRFIREYWGEHVLDFLLRCRAKSRVQLGAAPARPAAS